MSNNNTYIDKNGWEHYESNERRTILFDESRWRNKEAEERDKKKRQFTITVVEVKKDE